MSERVQETSPVAEAPAASAVTSPAAPARSDPSAAPASAPAGGSAAGDGAVAGDSGAASGGGAAAGSGAAAVRGAGGSSGAGAPSAAEGGGTLSPPRALAAAPPRYPDSARRSGAEGETLLRVHVRADGSVGQVLLDRSSGHPDLDTAASEAVRLWRFDPARRGPRPVDVWILLPVRFTLS
jgi:protein TonB